MSVIKEDIIQQIEEEVCSFGALRLALKEFRRMTGEKTIRSLALLRAYLISLSSENLNLTAQKIGCHLKEVAYPHIIS